MRRRCATSSPEGFSNSNSRPRGGDAEQRAGQASGTGAGYQRRCSSKSATNTANEAARRLIQTAEKEEKELDETLSAVRGRKVPECSDIEYPRDPGQGRTPPDAAHERIQWTRSAERALQDVQPRDAEEVQTTHDGSHQPQQSEVTHLDRWEAKVIALLRFFFNEVLSEKVRAAIFISMLLPNLQHALIQQAAKFEDYKRRRFLRS